MHGAKNIKYSLCVFVAIIIQHAIRIPAPPHFSTLPGKWYSCRLVIEHKMRVVVLSTTLSEIFLIPRQLKEILLKMYLGLHVKNSLLLTEYTECVFFSTNFQKIMKYKISRKSFH
jgi:hypothetical protein